MSDITRALSWAKNELISYPVWASTAIAAVVAQGTTLSWWSLSAAQTGEATALVMAVLGVTAAVLTDRVGLAVIVTALQAVAALSVGFTYHGSGQVALFIGAAVTLLGAFGHAFNTPAYGPRGTKGSAKAAAAATAGNTNPAAVTVTVPTVTAPSAPGPATVTAAAAEPAVEGP